jgi:hypothetical protein
VDGFGFGGTILLICVHNGITVDGSDAKYLSTLDVVVVIFARLPESNAAKGMRNCYERELSLFNPGAYYPSFMAPFSNILSKTYERVRAKWFISFKPWVSERPRFPRVRNGTKF